MSPSRAVALRPRPAPRLRTVRRDVRAFSDMALLLADAAGTPAAAELPMPDWRPDSVFGFVGILRGSDEDVVAGVFRWAAAYRVEPVIVDPVMDIDDRGWFVTAPGFAVVHLPVRGVAATVGGRLFKVPLADGAGVAA